LREKGIDVKPATDLIVGAVDDKYDVAVAVSSDADIIPAMHWTRNRIHKKDWIYRFSNNRWRRQKEVCSAILNAYGENRYSENFFGIRSKVLYARNFV